MIGLIFGESYFPIQILKKIKQRRLKYLVIDCLKISKHPSHFNLKECLYIHKCLKPKKTILTNLSNDLDYDFLIRRLPKNVVPAFDGLKINI